MLNDAPTQDDLSTESIDDFMARRRRVAANALLGPSMAHQDYGDAIRNGQDLDLSQPSDLMNYAARRIDGGLLGRVDQTPQSQISANAVPSSVSPSNLSDGDDGQYVGASQPSGSTNYMARLFGGSLLGPVGQLPQSQFNGGIELQPGDQAQPNSPNGGADPAPQVSNGKDNASNPTSKPDLHPGLLESLVPVWGSGKEAYADLKEGNYVGAGLNSTLALSDLFLVGDVAKAVGKGGWYAIRGPLFRKAWRQDWKEVRKQMGKAGMMQPRQEGHHWAIPQGGWGKNVPDFIKNHPLNIKAMPTQAMHRRIHGRWQGLPKFNQIESYIHGTPTWSKVATGAAIGHPVAAATSKDPSQ